MTTIPTEARKAIAAAAGVSVRTLDRFLTNPQSVGEATRTKLGEVLAQADPGPDVDALPPELEPPSKRVYAPAIKAQGEKTWKEAAKLHRKLGSVKAVAAHFGCSGTAAARWIRQGEELLGGK